MLAVDVNDDARVSPLDALLVINLLNTRPREERVLTGPVGNNNYFDPSGDSLVSPLDALLVINELNLRTNRVLPVALEHDSGSSATDRVTNVAAFQGNVKAVGLASPLNVSARIDRGPVISLPVDSAGNFVADAASFGGLQDGIRKATFATKYSDNSVAYARVTLTLDTLSPTLTHPKVDSREDTGYRSDDGVTNVANPLITLSTETDAHLKLVMGSQILFDGLATSTISQRTSNLADGTYQIVATATDLAGNVTVSDPLSLVIDTKSPEVPTIDLAPTSDSGTPGDLSTRYARVTLAGETEGNSFITVAGSNVVVCSSGNGTFRIPNISLNLGNNPVALSVEDIAGNSSNGQQAFIRVDEATLLDPVLRWNQATLESIRLDATAPQVATRALAMASIAMLDVVNAIEESPSYLVSLQPPADSSIDAAISAAAFRVLSYLYPAQQATLQLVLTAALVDIPDGPAKTNGVAFGTSVGNGVIAIRSHDGWDTFVDHFSSTAPGRWQATAPMYAVALTPQWGDVTPFAVSNVAALTPAAPPDLASQEYAISLNEVKELGRAVSSLRTDDQTKEAKFWADGGGTYTPPGHWNQIAAQFANSTGLSVGENARLFAMLNVALGDAAIVSWHSKYTYELWRPITAIQNADRDGNDSTTADATWSPLLVTPPFPEYSSGHSTFSAAASEILTSYFGDNQAFTATSIGLPGVSRSYTSFEDAAKEAGRSRVLGGIHYEFTNQASLASGHRIGQEVLSRFNLSDDTQAPVIVFEKPSTGGVGNSNTTINGWVIDNLAGVASAEIQVDGGSYKPLAMDAQNHFAFPTNLPLGGTSDGLHTFRTRVTDAAGNTSSREYEFTLDTRAPLISITSLSDTSTLSVASRLAGTADPTGSKLISLSYSFDGGRAVPVSFDSTTGDFDESLDLSRLSVGTHSLLVSARDAAGNTSTRTINLTLANAIPLTIAEVAPANGSDDVGVTFRPKIVFSRPIDPTTLSASNFYATDTTGAKLAATITPATDGTFAWLFFSAPLPGSSTITINLDGSTIRAADGSMLDAADSGTPGSIRRTRFTTVSTADVPNTSINGLVADPGTDLKPMTFDDLRAGPDGQLMTADDLYLNPIAHAKVYILGLEGQFVYTDSQGRFTLPSVPTGNVKLVIDGRTATNAPDGSYFPEMVMDVTVEPGRANTVMGSMGTREQQTAMDAVSGVWLPRVRTDILQPVNPTGVTTIGVTAESSPNLTPEQRALLSIQVQPGSLIGENGQVLSSGQVGISTVPAELVRDMLPAGLLQHTFDITIQAPGITNFRTPAPMTVPNVFNAAPGTKLNFLSFDHTTGRLVIEGSATVSADGLSVSTDPGTGITHPGWHGLTPPGSQGVGNNPPPPSPAACGDVPPGMIKLDTARLDALDPGLTALYPVIISAFSPFTPRINHGNDGRHSFNSRHYSNKAIDISGVKNFVTGERYSTPEALAIAGQIAGTGLQQIGTGNNYAAYFSANGVNYRIIFEDAGTSNSHFHIEVTDGASPGNRDNPLPSDCQPSTAATSAPPATQPSPPFFVWMRMDNGLVLRTTSNSLGAFSFMLPSNMRGTLVLLDPRTSMYWSGEFYTSTSGEVTRVTHHSESDWNRQYVSGGDSRYASPQGGAGVLSWTYDDTPDVDGDGLGAMAEMVYGTNDNNWDSNNNGINDSAELKQGLDPLDGRAFPTGVISSLPLQGQAREVVVEGSILDPQGQTAYVATGTYGLAVVEASRFQRPLVLGQLDLAGDASDVAVDSNLRIAAVASNSGGLHFVNVGDPAAPQLLRTISADATQVEVVNGIAYATVGTTIQAYDLLTGELRDSVSRGDSVIAALAREGTMLYTLDSGNRLRAIDIGSFTMVAKGTLDLPAGGGKLFVGNGVAFIGVPSGGFVTANVSNANTLVLLSGVDTANLMGNAVVANGSGLAVSVGTVLGPVGQQFTALDVLNVSDPTNTAGFLTRINLPSAPNSVVLAAGIAFVANGSSGLQVVNYQPFDNRGIAPTVSINTTALDVDPNTPGVQVVEGITLPVRATIRDDVQVRNVELIVNGQVVRNDVSFPFDFSVIAPAITPISNTVTVQVRVTDTGGNSTLSDPLTLGLVPDIFSPTIVNVSPADGSIQGRNQRTVRVQFSEALDAATVTNSTFRLLNSQGQQLLPQDIGLRNNDELVQLTFASLPLDKYQLVISAAAVTDRAGNALDAADVMKSFTVGLYSIVWANPAGGDWNNPANWDLGRLPNALDDVLIDVPNSNAVIAFGGGTTSVRSLVTNGTFSISGGTFSVVADSSVANLTMSDGALSGNSRIAVKGTFDWSGGTLSGLVTVALDSSARATIRSNVHTFSGGWIDNTLGAIDWLSGIVGSTAGNTFTNVGALNLVGASYKRFDSGRLVNRGTLTWASGDWELHDGPVIENAAGGLIDVRADQTMFATGLPSSVVNVGTLRKSAGTGVLTLSGVALSNISAVQVQTGTLAVGGGGTHAGTIDVAAGAAVWLNGLTTVQAGATFVGAGFTRVIGSTTRIVGTASAANFALDSVAGGLAGSGTLTVSGVFDWTAGTLGETVTVALGASAVATIRDNVHTFSGGRIDNTLGAIDWLSGIVSSTAGNTFTNVGALNLVGASYKRFDSGRLVNRGTLTWASGDWELHDGPVIENAAGGVVDVRADQTMFATGGGSPLVVNAGTLRKSAGTGVLTLSGVALSNTGSVQVQTGTFAVGGGGTHAGSIDVAAGAAVWLNGLTTVQAGAAFVGAGFTRVIGSTTNVLGTASAVNFAVDSVAGGLAGSGTLTVSGVFDWTAGTLGETVTVALGASAVATIRDNVHTFSGGRIDNTLGAIDWLSGIVSSTAGNSFTNVGALNLVGGLGKRFDNGRLVNRGTLKWGSGDWELHDGPVIENAAGGVIDVRTDQTMFATGGGSPLVVNAGTLRKSAGTGVLTLSGVTINNTGAVEAQSGTLQFSSGLTQTNGSIVLNGGAIGGGLIDIQGGSLSGSGTVSASVRNGGLVSPGGATGVMIITGSYKQLASGVLKIELGGLNAGTQYDQLMVNGVAVLDGTLDVVVLSGFSPALGNLFRPLTFGSQTGAFATVSGLNLVGGLFLILTYDTKDLTLTVG